jgi:predicted amidophosphoribosyltransferase
MQEGINMNTPKDDPRGDWELVCSCCGEQIDEDTDYCGICRDHTGHNWQLIDDNNEVIDEIEA